MRERFRIGLGAALPAALLLLLGTVEVSTDVLLPAFCHELGHLLALWLLGLHIRSIRMELRGFCIEYYGSCSAVGHALAAAAGPFAGFAWAWAASAIGQRTGLDWLSLSAGVSLLLSLFNLLPALPLDGGRIVLALSCAVLGDRRGEHVTEALSLFVGAALLGAGVWLMLRQRGVAVLAAAIWLLLYQENGRGLVKRGEMI